MHNRQVLGGTEYPKGGLAGQTPHTECFPGGQQRRQQQQQQQQQQHWKAVATLHAGPAHLGQQG